MSSYPSETSESARRDRFVTLCQQLLALAVVVAVLTPAARTVTMDVRPAEPVDVLPRDVGLRAASFPSKVPAGPVPVEVEEFALTAPAGAARARSLLRATARSLRGGGQTVTSQALPVDGYGTVGVTWSRDEEVSDEEIGVKVRTRKDGRWSTWTAVDYHDEHGPDPRSAEGRRARPGTEPLLVGTVEAVQVRVATTKGAPADMRLAVIDPGKATATSTESPAIDTGRIAGRAATTEQASEPASDPVDDSTTDDTGSGAEDDVTLQAAASTPRPKIYSRAQWGADERLRDKSALSYYEVHAGFVHHTVNANNYTAAEVPGIIRGIYSYHTRSRGWSDVGYNFLVDKFGRIWEGRAGGVERPVVGAHTLNYNSYSFAMSAIGNFEIVRPPAAMVNAYGALFAWKLALHGVDAADMRQKVGPSKFPAINGHRDAGSTACPGRYLYAQLGAIRSLAASGQRGWSGREVLGNYRGSATNDLLTRRIRDDQLVIQEITWRNGGWRLRPKFRTGIYLKDAQAIYKAGDWDRDGRDDFFVRRSSDGAMVLYRGKGGGAFHPGVVLVTGLTGMSFLAATGDVTGDGWPDLMGQRAGGKPVRIYPGRGMNGLARSYPAYSAVAGSQLIAPGRWNNDGAPEGLVRNGSRLTLFFGNGPGGWTRSKVLSAPAGGWDWIVGIGPWGEKPKATLIVRDRDTKKVWMVTKRRGQLGEPVYMNSRAKFDLAG